MINQNKIAVLDTEVNGEIVNLADKLRAEGNGVYEEKGGGTKGRLFSHGTQCAMIIKKYCPRSSLAAIRILEDDNTGSADRLRSALKWCYENQYRIVNLSLGTTNLSDGAAMLAMINHYANKGMLIIAAASNSGYLTFPASFSNVIGVCSKETMERRKFDCINLGIDVIAEAEHTLSVGGTPVTTSGSNSFAAPCVTALLARMGETGNLGGVSEIKNQLCSRKGLYRAVGASCGMPDWISYGFLADIRKESSVDCYFEVSGIEAADTVIAASMETLEQYKTYGRHMVYLGAGEIQNPDTSRFFWSKHSRIRQIIQSRPAENKIDVPILAWKSSKDMDEIELLMTVREAFEKDGYTVYAASARIDSVLYGIEYIPKEVFRRKKELYQFLYWQSCYRQNSLIFIVEEDIISLQDIFGEIDLIAEPRPEASGICISLICDGNLRKALRYEKYDRSAVLDTYETIKNYLTEETCE